MAATLQYLSANVQTSDASYEQVVIRSQRSQVQVHRQGRLVAQRDDVALVQWDPADPGAATITFADGTQWTAQRLDVTKGGCGPCAARAARRAADRADRAAAEALRREERRAAHDGG